jgi:hypothetical protein
VKAGSAWPSHSCTCLTLRPASNSSDAQCAGGVEADPHEPDALGGWLENPVGDVNRALLDVQLWGFTQYEKRTVVARADSIFERAVELMTEDEEFADVIVK